MRIFITTLLIAAGASAMLGGPAFGDDLPKRKSGLWEIKSSSAAMRDEARSIELCVDQKDDNITGQITANAKKMCSKTDVHRDGDRLTIDSVCKFGQTTATTKSVISGDF